MIHLSDLIIGIFMLISVWGFILPNSMKEELGIIVGLKRKLVLILPLSSTRLSETCSMAWVERMDIVR